MSKIYLICEGSPLSAFGVYSSLDKAAIALHERTRRSNIQYAHILEIGLDVPVTDCFNLKEVSSILEGDYFGDCFSEEQPMAA